MNAGPLDEIEREIEEEIRTGQGWLGALPSSTRLRTTVPSLLAVIIHFPSGVNSIALIWRECAFGTSKIGCRSSTRMTPMRASTSSPSSSARG